MPKQISAKKAAAATSAAHDVLRHDVFGLFYQLLRASEILPAEQTGELVRSVSRWGRSVCHYHKARTREQMIAQRMGAVERQGKRAGRKAAKRIFGSK